MATLGSPIMTLIALMTAACFFITILLTQTAIAEITDITITKLDIRRSLNPSDQSYLICDVCGLSPIRYLSATLQATGSNISVSQQLPFITIIEVRNSDGTTVFLEFNMGTLNGNTPSEVGVVWQPTDAGQYELRVFAISNFKNPEILSGVQTFKYDLS
jgi:hypothetical protein